MLKAHAILARCPDGELLEIGSVASPAIAARILHALEHELGDEYQSFRIVESEEAVTCRGLTYDEIRPRLRAVPSGSASAA